MFFIGQPSQSRIDIADFATQNRYNRYYPKNHARKYNGYGWQYASNQVYRTSNDLYTKILDEIVEIVNIGSCARLGTCYGRAVAGDPV